MKSLVILASNQVIVFLSVLLVSLLSITSPSQAAVTILSDSFEGYTGSTSTSYVPAGDFDPGTPPIGEPWFVVENGGGTGVQVIQPPGVLGAFQFAPAPGSGIKYLQLNRGSDSVGPEAWSPIAASNQTLMASFGQMTLSLKTLNVDGDGYVDGMRIVGFNSAVTNYTNPLFDIRYEQALVGTVSSGNVQYFNGTNVVNSGLTFDENVWENLRVFVDFNAGTFNITVDGATSANFALLGTASNIQSLMFAGPTAPLFGAAYNTRYLIDDVLLEVPEPSSLALFGASLVWFFARRRGV